MSLTTEIKQRVSKDNISNYIILWEELHNYLLTLQKKEIGKKECVTILKKFRDACSLVHETFCRPILEHPDAETRKLECPFYNLCAASKKMSGHKNYCEIAAAARDMDFKKVEELLLKVSDDSLKEIKNIKEVW